MIEKARRATAFLSWYRQTSLPEDKFALVLHAWTRFFFSFSYAACFCCFSTFILKNKKKRAGGRKMQIFIPLFSFSDIICIFT